MSRRRGGRGGEGGTFDNTLDFLKTIDGEFTVPVSFSTDEDGNFDRECPHDECLFHFKVHLEDWEQRVPVSATCPRCGHQAPRDTHWWTQDQLAHQERAVENYVDKGLHDALEADAKQSTRRWGSDLFGIRFEMTVDSPPPLPLPAHTALDAMEKKWACDKCACRYASVGAPFYCPSCGRSSAVDSWDLTITTLKGVLDNLGDIEVGLVAVLGKDHGADMLRDQIIEPTLNNLVGDFEHLSRMIFAAQPGASGVKVHRTDFQKPDVASRHMVAVGLKRYEDILDAAEWADLVRYYQQRHVLTHCNGFVDQKYIDVTGDVSYALGQRIVVKPATISRFVELLEKLVAELRTHA